VNDLERLQNLKRAGAAISYCLLWTLVIGPVCGIVIGCVVAYIAFNSSSHVFDFGYPSAEWIASGTLTGLISIHYLLPRALP